jgi:hypothetical protein
LTMHTKWQRVFYRTLESIKYIDQSYNVFLDCFYILAVFADASRRSRRVRSHQRAVCVGTSISSSGTWVGNQLVFSRMLLLCNRRLWQCKEISLYVLQNNFDYLITVCHFRQVHDNGAGIRRRLDTIWTCVSKGGRTRSGNELLSTCMDNLLK